ncbi:MAG: peptide deformylase [Oscillospiraceae bacterium]|nr:peptide deformylase [Oscillospiraceae bacterium]
MIRELVHDPIFLAKKSETATLSDIDIAKDLLETLIHHQDGCVGMAANMIGETKRIIAFDNDGEYMVMFNPVILKKSEPYDAQESCLSLLGGPRKAKRYNSIKVQYQTQDFKTRIKTFKGFTAQIIQHEVDHCDGILI